MRLVAQIGLAATLMMSPGAPLTATAGVTTSPSSSDDGKGPIPKALKKVAWLRILPGNPRQASHVRIFVHCPKKANHAIIGSTAFQLKGSRRIYREVGMGFSDRGLGHRGVSISYYALPGWHKALLKCVKVTINKKTRISRTRVLGRDAIPLYVRRFSIWQYFG
ncbi:hypothetical protein [Nonomuraea guangzhouensis]|uniref:Uncharacterized protein n=1 Tax=Nonomuraea guangzhouensis TaxID=1291555 RepID=A0ABW4FZL4_9ACTN|nr:hypothetical protein [Nonomuraea guangzhouensis]